MKRSTTIYEIAKRIKLILGVKPSFSLIVSHKGSILSPGITL